MTKQTTIVVIGALRVKFAKLLTSDDFQLGQSRKGGNKVCKGSLLGYEFMSHYLYKSKYTFVPTYKMNTWIFCCKE